MKLALTILSFLLLSKLISPVKGQHISLNYADSLLRKIRDSKQETTKAHLFDLLARFYRARNSGLSLRYFDSGLLYAAKANWERKSGVLYVNRGWVLMEAGRDEDAIKDFVKAYKIGRKVNDSLMIVGSISNIGAYYYHKSDYIKAIEYCLKAEELSKRFKIDYYGVYTILGDIYSAQKDFDKSLYYHKKAMSISKKLNRPNIVSGKNIGEVYLQKGDKKSAEYYFEETLDIAKERGDKIGEAIMLSRMAFLYKPDYEEVIRRQKDAQGIWDSLSPQNYNSMINLGNLGESYLSLFKSDSANRLSIKEKNQLLEIAGFYLRRAITYSKQTSHKDRESHYSLKLAEQLKYQAKYEEAFEVITNAYQMRDSLFSQENKNKIAAIEGSREIEARDKQIQINQLALSNERRTRWGITAGAGLFLVIGGLLFYQNRLRRKTNTTLLTLNNELDEANKVKTKFFGILSHDLRSPIVNLINFLHLQKEMPDLFSKERQAHHQKELTESAENLLETMEAMLLWSKSQMEHFAPQKKTILVQNLFEFLQKQFNVPGINFQDPGQLTVSSDEDYLKTIMYNLTANAIKALANTENPQIVWKARQNGNQIELSITDNGPGVHQEQLDALYNENAVVGTRHGLGLHLIRDLAKAINCRVLHQPGFEKGSVFQLIM